tara:strand:+ start:9266 stop:10615 length:1350 start_codon:yes stop_codon:yes gene_type:complete
MKTITPGAQSLEKLAFVARNRGYNARVVKNKSSHSLYIRPRRYNRPIPETDPSRISTFPTALAMSSPMGRTLLGRQLGSSEEISGVIPSPIKGGETFESFQPSIPANASEISDYIAEVYSENKEQIDGQQAEIEAWLSAFATQENNLKNLKIQSNYNLSDLSYSPPSRYSNLDESQWGLIQSEPKIAELLKSETMNNVLEKTAIKGLIDIDGLYKMDSKIPYSDKLSLVETPEEIILTRTENGATQNVNRYPIKFFDMYFDKVKNTVLGEWRKEFIGYLNEEGESEHSLLASMIRKDSLEDIQYWKWPGYDRDVVKQLIKQETNLEPSSNGITLSINIDQAALESFLQRIGVSSIIESINRPYERRYFTEPRKTFSHGNETRQRIANYLWQRKITGDEVISTDDIQRHLSKNMKKPPVTRQTTKFLDQDPRFQDVGKIKKVKLWKLKGE